MMPRPSSVSRMPRMIFPAFFFFFFFSGFFFSGAFFPAFSFPSLPAPLPLCRFFYFWQNVLLKAPKPPASRRQPLRLLRPGQKTPALRLLPPRRGIRPPGGRRPAALHLRAVCLNFHPCFFTPRKCLLQNSAGRTALSHPCPLPTLYTSRASPARPRSSLRCRPSPCHPVS